MSLTDRTLGEEDILQKKSMIQEKFLHLSPDAIVLDDEVQSALHKWKDAGSGLRIA